MRLVASSPVEVLEISESVEEITDFSEVVVSKCEDLKEFIKMWREHFVQTMQPKYMPDYWNINHRLE